MRLIDITDLDNLRFRIFESVKFHEPDYAILSHRWGPEEISLKDFVKRRRLESQGWRKVKEFCTLAYNEGYHYCWIDTCCIDKTSSAELSEAVNSMYDWYCSARVCYAYLEDVDLAWKEYELMFHHSEWFTRGWTLQELLAPKHVVFLDRGWNSIGTRRELVEQIAGITRISRNHLNRLRRRLATSTATIMSWASSRQTTRPEDRAYSLLGLFDIQMPLLYGEGEVNAFFRLQKLILESSEDQSIFLWNKNLSAATGGNGTVILAGGNAHGILADTVSDFAMCPFLPSSSLMTWDKDAPEIRMTNKGLRLDVMIRPSSRRFNGSPCWIVPLNCSAKFGEGKDEGDCAAIELLEISGKFYRMIWRNTSNSVTNSHLRSDVQGFQRRVIYCPR